MELINLFAQSGTASTLLFLSLIGISGVMDHWNGGTGIEGAGNKEFRNRAPFRLPYFSGADRHLKKTENEG